MSFFTLLHEKKRQLQPLSSRHLLLPCGEESVMIHLLGLNKQETQKKIPRYHLPYMTLFNFSRLVLLRLIAASGGEKQAKHFRDGGDVMLKTKSGCIRRKEKGIKIAEESERERTAQSETVCTSNSAAPYSAKKNKTFPNKKRCT